MGSTTKISWCDSTFNPWIGCTKVSPGCANCYAEAMMHRWGKDIWGPGKPRQRTSAANWKQPLKWEAEAARTGIRRKVFCGSLCDWLDPEIPIEWLADLLDLIRRTPHLDWLLLTKRPELYQNRLEVLLAWLEDGGLSRSDKWPGLLTLVANMTGSWGGPTRYRLPNVWIGATVENQEMADKRIPELLKIPARVRFLSCEPLLGPINLNEPMPGPIVDGIYPPWYIQSGIDWVICGGESGPRARPMHPDWARSLRDQCKAAGVPFFFKQWGEWAPVEAIDGSLEGKEAWISLDGEVSDGSEVDFFGGDVQVIRVGKAHAGHLLDGVEHHEFPRAESEA